MIRFLAALLLICYVPLASVQATPLRFCWLEHRVLFAGGALCAAVEKTPCCDACDLQGGHEGAGDCCVDLEGLADAAMPLALEKLPAPALAVLPFAVELEVLHPLPSMEARHALPPPAPRPLASAGRQAILSVWTV